MIKFDKEDRVAELDVIDDGYSGDVNIAKEYTKSSGSEISSMQKFIKNFGRFNKAPKSKKQRHGAPSN
jgi:outer membrane protein assembly factor BamE (lipoprotein component of BamABCDE complex)